MWWTSSGKKGTLYKQPYRGAYGGNEPQSFSDAWKEVSSMVSGPYYSGSYLTWGKNENITAQCKIIGSALMPVRPPWEGGGAAAELLPTTTAARVAVGVAVMFVILLIATAAWYFMQIR